MREYVNKVFELVESVEIEGGREIVLRKTRAVCVGVSVMDNTVFLYGGFDRLQPVNPEHIRAGGWDIPVQVKTSLATITVKGRVKLLERDRFATDLLFPPGESFQPVHKHVPGTGHDCATCDGTGRNLMGSDCSVCLGSGVDPAFMMEGGDK